MNKTGLPEKRFLDSVSYETQVFKKSLNSLHLSKVELSDVLIDLIHYKKMVSLNTEINQQSPFRIKSRQSIILKHEKCIKSGRSFTACFNDVLSFRVIVDTYPALSSLPKYFRIVDLRQGKQNDDGYRGMHLYYRKNNMCYPIELQVWSTHDWHFNTLAHTFIYKYYPDILGAHMRKLFDAGEIGSEQEFIMKMHRMIGV